MALYHFLGRLFLNLGSPVGWSGWSDCLRIHLSPSPPAVCRVTISFCMDTEDLNTGPHVCMADNSLTEPLLHVFVFLFPVLVLKLPFPSTL